MLKCYHCHGVFSKGMNIEKVGEKNCHTYCASVERKKRRGQKKPTTSLWSTLFFPWLLV